ncbi:hypothetical protein, partial [Streptomyces klenkii]|uniref:hypothetical protein n=1 Tax=Streptomyces klenkii TaxID=1420899 RepID=UPI003F4B50B8
MLWATPALRQASGKSRLLYCVPRPVCMIAPAGLPRVRSAAARASVTGPARVWSAMAERARRRE